MMKRSAIFLGGMKPYHEWQMHEPLLQNYEGWRILDNPKMGKMEALTWDFAGISRHLDPIIDDPRLTHKQRVCRLYRWALKEFINYFANGNAWKFNLGYKVIRGRFEKYRYVTDPGMCDMMVRETQKYMREMCNNAYFRRDPRSKDTVQTLTNPMFHPDNGLCYDHWTPYEVQLYGDAKIHRYVGHNPNMAGLPEMHDRFGDNSEVRKWWRKPALIGTIVVYSICVLWASTFFYHEGWHDPYFDILRKHYKQETIQSMEMFERSNRHRYGSASVLSYDWDTILGKVNQKTGLIWTGTEWDKHRQTVVRDPYFKTKNSAVVE